MKAPAISSRFILNHFLSVTIFIAFGFTAIAQPQTRVINPSLYRKFIQPGTQSRIQTVDNGRVEKTDTAILTDFKVPVNKKTVISLKNTSLTDNKSLDDFKAYLKIPYAKEQVNILPELHIETGEGQAQDKAYGIVFTLQQPLHYNDSSKKFSAKLSFLLASETEDNYKPIEPVKIEVTSDQVSSIDPRHLSIDHLSIPSSDVDIIADRVNDSVKVQVRTVSNTDGYTTYLKVRPTLEISSNSTALQGLGIQDIPINIKFVGYNPSDSMKVSFSSQKGVVTPNSVYLSHNNPSTVYLRSDGLGSSKLSATSSLADSNTLQFSYVFPWLFLLAAVIGGLTGSLAKYFLGGDEKGSAVKPIIGGVLIGIIGAVAWYGLGVNLLGAKLSPALNALAVFALSALCAYFGISLIKMDGKA